MDGDTSTDLGLGPFGHPLFADPEVRALSRVGVIDVGSNSVRMVVFDGAARSPAYFYNEKVMAALGADMVTTGALNPTGKMRAEAAIRRFVRLAHGMNVEPLVAVATAAMREATDGPAFCKTIEDQTGLKLWIIDGAEEARLSAQGVLLGWPGAEGVMCDIGGSSMELAEIAQGEIGRRATSPLGPFRLIGIPGGKKGMKAHIDAEVAKLVQAVPGKGRKLYLVGGSWRAVARLDMLRRNYPLAVLHEYEMTRSQLRETMDWIDTQDLEDLRLRSGIGQARISLVPQAIQVLRPLVAALKPSSVAMSSYGIREGLLYEQMPEEMRRRDPLIEACRFAEARSARMPGFGSQLFDFLLPIYRSARADKLRLVRAACLLHDVGWRAHPDYRSEVAFDIATQANLASLSHSERVQLGMSLLHRYKNSAAGSRFVEHFELLSPEERREAEVLGKAMRFGAMFAGQQATEMGELRFFPKKKRLELLVRRVNVELFGEVAEARFGSLGKALDVETALVVVNR